jgi:hypothetical protein
MRKPEEAQSKRIVRKGAMRNRDAAWGGSDLLKRRVQPWIGANLLTFCTFVNLFVRLWLIFFI